MEVDRLNAAIYRLQAQLVDEKVRYEELAKDDERLKVERAKAREDALKFQKESEEEWLAKNRIEVHLQNEISKFTKLEGEVAMARIDKEDLQKKLDWALMGVEYKQEDIENQKKDYEKRMKLQEERLDTKYYELQKWEGKEAGQLRWELLIA